MAGLGDPQVCVVCPVGGFGRAFWTGRIHGLHVDASLLQDADPPHDAIVKRHGADRHGAPGLVLLAEVLADLIGGAVLVGQAAHHVVNRVQPISAVMNLPYREDLKVVASFR